MGEFLMKEGWMRSFGRYRAVAGILVLFFLLAGPSAAAAEEGGSGWELSTEKVLEGPWQFELAPYAWFVFLGGTMTVFDQGNPVDVGFGTIWDHLHMAFFLDADVRKGDVGFYSDLSYSYLWSRSQGNLPTTNYKTDLYLLLFDFGLYWEALKYNFGSEPSDPRLRLQPLVGGRYYHNGIDVRRDSLAGQATIEPRLNSVAPVLGLRAFVDLGERWNLSFVGDGGGFGVDGMDVTWQAEGLIGYRFQGLFSSRLDLNLSAGYKGLEVDYKASAIESDLTFRGPVLRFGIEF
jgi:hypothetical protein